METVDFEKDLFNLFAGQLKAMYGLQIPAGHIELLGMVSFQEFGGFDFHRSFMEEAEIWFTAYSNTHYTGDDVQLWKLNDYLILVREKADSEPQVFGIYARDER